jgi:peptide/nickel transport system permease protein
VRGDLGTSLRTGEPVVGQVASRVPATAELAAAAMIVALLVALPLGIAAAVWRGTAIDASATALALAGVSITNF